MLRISRESCCRECTRAWRFRPDRIDPPFLVPDAALVVRASGTVLAVLQPLTPDEQEKVSADGMDQATVARVRRVHFQTVTPGRDYGIELEIPSGLKLGQEVVVDPSDAVQEGALVQIAAPNSNVKSWLKKGTDRSVHCRSRCGNQYVAAGDRVVCPLFQPARKG